MFGKNNNNNNNKRKQKPLELGWKRNEKLHVFNFFAVPYLFFFFFFQSGKFEAEYRRLSQQSPFKQTMETVA